MSRPGIAHKTLLVPLVSLVLLLPGAGPATAHHRGGQSQPPRPAALPSVSQLLRDTGLADLVAQLLQVPIQPARGGVPSAVASRAAASTVKVSSVACGERVEGSGFSPEPDTVVTNAHVVAGATRSEVLRPDGRRLPAQVQVFDPNRDLAVLSVPGLGQQPLPLGSAVVGGDGAILGHPRGQVSVDVSPAVVVRRVMATTSDIYGEGAIRRPILVLAARLAPGDSGAPLIDPSGQVTGVAFAVSALRASTAFAIPSETLAPVLDQSRTGAVSTGPCLG